MKNFYKLLFLNLMITGSLISISSLSWLTAWMGLEMNLLAIMPLMKTPHNKYSAESSIKYFITQAMASSMLLFSILVIANFKSFSLELFLLPSTLINASLFMKMGAAPFHFWLPEVVSGLTWKMVFLMLTWQKIAPMILLSYNTIYNIMFISIIIILSSLISGIQGMNQTSLRKIMAYSSINHSSWMISTIFSSLNTWLYYFIIYTIINFNILAIFNKYQMNNLNQLSKLLPHNKNMKILFMMNFLSLGGLPPFLGFFPKWMAINFLMYSNFYALSFFLIIFTLISLYLYLRITFSSLSLNYNESIINNIKKTTYFHFYFNLISLMGLTMCLFLINFY